MSASEAIREAEALLPGEPVYEGGDARWQAVIAVGHYVETNPEEVWRFIVRWGGHEQEDLRDAVACVLLEHLLEYHFELIFPRVQRAAGQDRMFADMFCRCWKFGQSDFSENAKRFDELQDWCRSVVGT